MSDAKERDAQRKAEQRQRERDLSIPRIGNLRRRRRCLKDVYLFLRTYFSWIFYQPFTESREQMIRAIVRAAEQSDDQAVAGPRGDGKTRSALFTALWLSLRNKDEFPLVISKSGNRAALELKNLKYALMESVEFEEDFPELMIPIAAIGRWASAAKKQTVYGESTDIEWGAESIVFPKVPTKLLTANGWNRGVDSCACNQIFSSLGIEGPIRGYSIRNRRPTLAIIDDIDDRESARSELQTQSRIEIIDSDVAGLGGPGRNISRVILCTSINRTCTAYIFTDRQQRPSFHGQRHKLITKMPDNWGLSEEYISLRQNRNADTDPDAREAHRWYLEHRKEIEAGYETSNPYRFNTRPLSDGEPAEVSTLQSYLNWIADKGLTSALTELQNDPPEETGLQESGITARRIQCQVSGYNRKIVPPGCEFVTQGIDVRKVALHWVVRAWHVDESKCLITGYTIDYGVQDVWGTTQGSDEGLDDAVKRAILARKDAMEREPYREANGHERKINTTLIDAGWRTEAIYEVTRGMGLDFKPAMGFGKSNGCVKTSFESPVHTTPDKKVGDRWFLSRRPKGVWLVAMDADFWKSWEHDRWMSDPNKDGVMLLYGSPSDRPDRLSADQKAHFSYSKHLTAEVEVEEVVKGVIKRYWKAKSDSNHYLDASYMSNVAASMLGVRLVRTPTNQQTMDASEWFK